MEPHCASCKYQVDPDDIVHIVNWDIICETCYSEKMCHRCDQLYEYIMVCINCKRHIALTGCPCLAITWCQSAECICRDCLSCVDYEVKCHNCNVNILELLKDEEYPGICEDGDEKLLCEICRKS